MSWAAHNASAAVETLRGVFTGDDVRVAVVAIDADGHGALVSRVADRAPGATPGDDRIRGRRQLAWITRDGRILWHNGGTGGFAASVGIDREEHRAIGIMVNVHGRSVGTLDNVVVQALPGGDVAESCVRPGAASPGPEWDARGRELRDLRDVSVSSRTLAAGIGVLVVVVDGVNESLSLLATFTPSGQIAGLRILGPDETAPW